MKNNNLKEGYSIDVLIKNRITSFVQKDNKIISASGTKVKIQLNAPYTVMHLSTMEFDTTVNKNTVVGYGGKSIYSLIMY